ncbi:MAG: hypothetical protein R3335_00635 [Anaerolineales bacterium]|nr:hypothetical protein [Anaerolineales bacterium]
MPIFNRTVSYISMAIAIGVGIVVALGYFLEFAQLGSLRQLFLEWAILVAAMALIVGVVNLALVHLRRVGDGGLKAVYSAVLLGGLIITFLVGVVLGSEHELSLLIFNTFQVPVELTLMAILAVSLAYASARMLNQRLSVFSIIFVITALLVLLGTARFPWGSIPVLGDVILPLLRDVFATAGGRGILLGVALGTIATSLRILMGNDRPYGG